MVECRVAILLGALPCLENLADEVKGKKAKEQGIPSDQTFGHEVEEPKRLKP